ncbi:hypothetical protein Tco_1191964 [Tanacetum coccineum]
MVCLHISLKIENVPGSSRSLFSRIKQLLEGITHSGLGRDLLNVTPNYLHDPEVCRAEPRECRTTQNSGICAPGPDGEMSYGQLQEILEFKYLSFKVALFRVKWFDTRNNGRVKKLTFRNGMTQIMALMADVAPRHDGARGKVPAGDKARLMATLGATEEEHRIRDPRLESMICSISGAKPDEYTDDEWEKYINSGNDPANAQRAETNRLNRSQEHCGIRHGSRSGSLSLTSDG